MGLRGKKGSSRETLDALPPRLKSSSQTPSMSQAPDEKVVVVLTLHVKPVIDERLVDCLESVAVQRVNDGVCVHHLVVGNRWLDSKVESMQHNLSVVYPRVTVMSGPYAGPNLVWKLRNFAVEAARKKWKTDFVLFVDDDNMLLQRHVQDALDLFAKHPSVEATWSHRYIVKSTGAAVLEEDEHFPFPCGSDVDLPERLLCTLYEAGVCVRKENNWVWHDKLKVEGFRRGTVDMNEWVFRPKLLGDVPFREMDPDRDEGATMEDGRLLQDLVDRPGSVLVSTDKPTVVYFLGGRSQGSASSGESAVREHANTDSLVFGHELDVAGGGDARSLRRALLVDGYARFRAATSDAIQMARTFVVRLCTDLDVINKWDAVDEPQVDALKKWVIVHAKKLLECQVGVPVSVCKVTALVKSKKAGDRIPLHQDEAYRSQYDLTFWVPLQAVQRGDGPVEYVKGSHNGPCEPLVDFWNPEFRELDPPRRPVTEAPMELGEVLVHMGRTWHASRAWEGDDDRLRVALAFRVKAEVPGRTRPLPSEPAIACPYGMANASEVFVKWLQRISGCDSDDEKLLWLSLLESGKVRDEKSCQHIKHAISRLELQRDAPCPGAEDSFGRVYRRCYDVLRSLEHDAQ